jgi:hypothetical protein
VTPDREDVAIRAALERRRPTSAPPELRERLAAIPSEIEPLPGMPVRIALGIAPWAVLAAAVVVLVRWPALAANSPQSPITIVPPWDPSTTGGYASTGLLAVPWIPIAAWIAGFGAIATIRRIRTEGTAVSPRTWLGWVRSYLFTRSPSLAGRIGGTLLWFVPLLGVQVIGSWDPLVSADPFGPGPLVAEGRTDGVWQEDWIEHASSYQTFPGPCVQECPGPRYVYRLRPGDMYTWLVTIRNEGGVPVTLLGRNARDGQLPLQPSGLALLRNPGLLSADQANLRAFDPVSLPPGETVTVAMVQTADTCADPAADVTQRGRYAASYPLVYDVLGWRRVGDVFPHFSVTVAGCD